MNRRGPRARLSRQPLRPVVLAYHAIGDCPPAEDPANLFLPAQTFAEQMSFLARTREVVPLEEIVKLDRSERSGKVAITFDDAYRSVATTALPILRSHGFAATVFAPTRWLGDRNRWDAATNCDLSIMSPEELREASTRGLSVESHGHAHLDMQLARDEDIQRDLAESISVFEQSLGGRPRFLAFPYGRTSERAQDAARRAGFEAAFTIDARHGGTYSFERVQITRLDGGLLFSIKASGRYLAVRHSPPVSRLYRAARPLARRVLLRP